MPMSGIVVTRKLAPNDETMMNRVPSNLNKNK